MNKILAWIIGTTKVGRAAKAAQTALNGKKQMLVSLGTAIPATLTILVKFSEHGTPYLIDVASTPEFAAASLGWVGFFNAVKGEKIRAENAEILARLPEKTPIAPANP